MNTIINNSFSMLNNRSVVVLAIPNYLSKFSFLQSQTTIKTLQQHREHSRSARRNTSSSSSSTAATTTTPTTNKNEGEKRATTSKEPFSVFLASSLQQQQQHPHDHDNSNSQKMAMVSMPPPAPPAAANEPRRKKNTTTSVPPGFWRDKQNHRRFFDWAATQLNVRNSCLDDWYQITGDDVRKIGGCGLLQNHYDGSLQQALASVYPEHEWLPWKFRQASQGFWRDKRNHRKFFDWAATQLNVRTTCLDDWYTVTCEDVYKLGGRGLIQNHYEGSLQQALASVYPEHDWLPWKFICAGRLFWRDKRNHRKFFDWAATQLNVRNSCLDDWYMVTCEDVHKLGGRGLLQNHYDASLQQALASVYPEHEWLPWKFRQVPSSFWRDKRNHRKFFDWAATQLNVRSSCLDDWYMVTCEEVYKLGGQGLLQYYNHSLQQALASVYPEHEWLPWKFHQVPPSFWRDKRNHRKFFDWAATQLNVRNSCLDDWYVVTCEDVHKLGGRGLLQSHYDASLQQALASVYPEHEWLPWKFRQIAHRFWRDKQNHRRFFDWAEKQLGKATTTTTTKAAAAAAAARTPDDDNNDNNSGSEAEQSTWTIWYTVSPEQVCELGGGTLLSDCYGGSLIRALAAVYPEREWDPWRFQWCALPKDELADEPTLRRYIERTLAVALRVETLDDWKRVSLSQARQCDGYATMVQRHGGLLAVLKWLYPDHEWDAERMRGRDKRSSQRMLRLATQKLFPGEEVVEEYHHPSLRFKDSNAPITIDVWVPSLSLALEYHGEQHYRDIHAMGDNPERRQRKDQEKAEACSEAGITLVAVPYWWSKQHSADELAALIARVRPELIIPKNATADRSPHSQ